MDDEDALVEQFTEAMVEWAGSDDAEAWEGVVADGLGPTAG
ncbi:hypothetical protein [Demequina phytophila]|nr:hypothetical protein [Demequina phytophila]